MRLRSSAGRCAIPAFALLAACNGGNSSGSAAAVPAPGATATPAATAAPTPTATVSTQQVIRMALPSSAIGTVNDPTFGTVGGYTQSTYSQVMAFAPGAQVMIQNAQSSSTPHTLGVFATASFPPGQGNLSFTASGGSTLAQGYQTGTVAAGSMVGPVTLQAGTYYIGCAYHYSIGMRDVIVVAANATPGTQATPQAGVPAPGPGNGY
jgi:hypothetical protein